MKQGIRRGSRILYAYRCAAVERLFFLPNVIMQSSKFRGSKLDIYRPWTCIMPSEICALSTLVSHLGLDCHQLTNEMSVTEPLTELLMVFQQKSCSIAVSQLLEVLSFLDKMVWSYKIIFRFFAHTASPSRSSVVYLYHNLLAMILWITPCIIFGLIHIKSLSLV